MTSSNTTIVGILACLIVATFPLRAQSQEENSEHTGKVHEVVRVGSVELQPQSIRLKTDEVVAWINYSGVPVQIVFDEKAAEKIHCKEPTRFHLTKDGSLTSGEVRPFETAALCSFLPGEYQYTVRRELGAGFRATLQESSGRIAVTE